MRRIAVLISLAVLSACSTAPGPQPVETNSGVQTPAPSAAPAAPAGSPEALKDAPKQPNDEKVAELRKRYEENPNDGAVKAAYADAVFQNAQFYMYSSPLPPNQKYPKALAMYREVLRLDPSNEAAKQSIETIEAIYRSLNRPVPNA